MGLKGIRRNNGQVDDEQWCMMLELDTITLEHLELSKVTLRHKWN